LQGSTVFVVDDNLNRQQEGDQAAAAPGHRVAGNQRLSVHDLYRSLDRPRRRSELIELMATANVGALFVGIESPNEESLRETRKLQNVRRGGTLVEKVRRIQDAGIEVTAGMIVGFDNDDATIFAAHRQFLEDARVPLAMLGMLTAIPKTPLYSRLAAAGRLDETDTTAYGTMCCRCR